MSAIRNPQDIQLDETSIKYEEIEYPDIRTLFKYFSKGRDNIEIKELVQTLSKHGFHYEQPRWKEYIDELNKYQWIDIQAFKTVFKHHLILLNQASPTEHELIIPQFQHFKTVLGDVFQQVRPNLKGDVTQQIPLLSKTNPDLFGMTVCTIDGQMQFYGDYKQNFSLQSCHTPISYGIALELLGENFVHEYVGQQPSGDLYDSHILTREGKPYNPLVNAGAITITSLLLSHYKNEPSDAYEGLIKWWQRLIGHGRPGFNNAIYLSEKHAADKNRALIYFLRGQGVFPIYKQDYCLEEKKSGSGTKEKILS